MTQRYIVSGPIESALPFVAALALCTLRWLPVALLVPVFAGHALGRAARVVLALAKTVDFARLQVDGEPGSRGVVGV